MKSDDELATVDLGLASYLVACGFPLLRLAGRPGRFTFYFPSHAADPAKQYYRDAEIPARHLVDAMTIVKSKIAAARLSA